jgi:acyl-CoA synthetase (AMP-forming)/AMP-acid ligase II
MDPLQSNTIPQLVRAAADRFADREAVVDGPVRWTYRRLAEEVDRFGRALAGCGVGSGDRVAIWAPNGHRWIVAALGTVCAGGIVVPVNTRFKGAEAHDILTRTGTCLLVVDDGFLGNPYVTMLRAAGPLDDLHTIVTLDESGWVSFLDRAGEPAGVVVEPGDVSDIFFTSGTTGRPKGAMLGHRQSIRLYTTWSERVGLREGDRYLIVNPFFHTFGYKAGLLACLLRGATMVPQRVFDVTEALRLVESERITILPGPPTLYASILDHPARRGLDLSSLRVAVTGAAVVPVALIERMRRDLTFGTVITAYGLTESCGTVTMCGPDDDATTVATTCGRPVPGVEVRVVDGSKTLGPGEPGEVVVRGYNVMLGYLDDPAATAEAVDADGWLRTGDVGVLDERGYLRITDRLKDMYIVGGFNTYPAEIEQTLVRHERVSEAAVIGVPDGRLGEVGRAFVVPRPGPPPTEAELIGYCRQRLANYKVPRSVVVVDALPRNATGKVVKDVLRNHG